MKLCPFTRLLPAIALAAALAGCQSGGGVTGMLGIGGKKRTAEPPVEEVEQVDLEAYCPIVRLREGTSYYTSYIRARRDENPEDPDNVIYQASIAEVTRSCNYTGGQLAMTVGVAGKVVPGPKIEPGSVNVPIRIAVLRGEEVLYSELHQYPVAVATSGATQFVFTDPNVVIPIPTARNILVLAGYDVETGEKN